jgi:hypothetical protein
MRRCKSMKLRLGKIAGPVRKEAFRATVNGGVSKSLKRSEFGPNEVRMEPRFHGNAFLLGRSVQTG